MSIDELLTLLEYAKAKAGGEAPVYISLAPKGLRHSPSGIDVLEKKKKPVGAVIS